MNKAVETSLLSLIGVGLYVALPVLIIWGWVRWRKRTQPRSWPSILSLIGFALATASGLLAASSVSYAHAIGGFPFYDCGFLGSRSGFLREGDQHSCGFRSGDRSAATLAG